MPGASQREWRRFIGGSPFFLSSLGDTRRQGRFAMNGRSNLAVRRANIPKIIIIRPKFDTKTKWSVNSDPLNISENILDPEIGDGNLCAASQAGGDAATEQKWTFDLFNTTALANIGKLCALYKQVTVHLYCKYDLSASDTISVKTTIGGTNSNAQVFNVTNTYAWYSATLLPVMGNELMGMGTGSNFTTIGITPTLATANDFFRLDTLYLEVFGDIV